MSNTKWLGWIALGTSFLGLMCAIYQQELTQLLFTTEPASVSDRVLDASRSFFDRNANYFSNRPPVFYVYSAIGLVGIALGVIAFARQGDWRLSAVACVLGTAAVAWEYILIAIFLAILLCLLMAFLKADIEIG